MRDCTGDPSDAAVADAREGFAELVAAAQEGRWGAEADGALGRFRYTAEMAGALLTAWSTSKTASASMFTLVGEIVGDLVVDAEVMIPGLDVSASVFGSLTVNAPCDLFVSAGIRGSFTVRHPAGTSGSDMVFVSDAVIDGDVVIGGEGTAGRVTLARTRIGGDLLVTDQVRLLTLFLDRTTINGRASIEGDARITDQLLVALVHGSVRIGGRAHIDGGVASLDAERGGAITIDGDAALRAPVLVSGRWSRLELGGTATAGTVLVGAAIDDISIGERASISGPLRIADDASIDGTFRVGDQARIDTELVIGGTIAGTAVLGGHVEDVTVEGAVADLVLEGSVGGAIRLTPNRPARLRSVRRARFEGPVHIGDQVSIVACDLRQCGDLDRLELVGSHLLEGADGATAKVLANPPAGMIERISDGEMASIYRQLRVNLEGKGNRPASAFFYRGEMDSRRRAARQRGGWAGWTEWGWIGLYRIVAGYGLRVIPPLLWFGVLVALGGIGFHALDLGRDWPATFVYTGQAMLSLFRPPDPSEDWRIGLLQIGLRVLGPILLGLAAFAVRDKVAR